MCTLQSVKGFKKSKSCLLPYLLSVNKCSIFSCWYSVVCYTSASSSFNVPLKVFWKGTHLWQYLNWFKQAHIQSFLLCVTPTCTHLCLRACLKGSCWLACLWMTDRGYARLNTCSLGLITSQRFITHSTHIHVKAGNSP